PDETLVVDTLRQQNDMQINMLAVKTNLPIARLTALLFEMELKGIVKVLAGGVYHLLGS
ncbi:MAG: DNA-protecting protein DprA, partial [Prevotella sp.]|nr:DNA-protecting protein DprA [Prevotella sp.]